MPRARRRGRGVPATSPSTVTCSPSRRRARSVSSPRADVAAREVPQQVLDRVAGRASPAARRRRRRRCARSGWSSDACRGRSLDPDEQRVARLAAVVARTARRRAGSGAGAPLTAVDEAVVGARAAHERDQLAAGAEQPVDDLDGDRARSVPTTAKSPSTTPRTSPGWQRPAWSIASRAAIVTAPCRRRAGRGGHRDDVVVERRARVVHGERGEALDLRAGRDHATRSPRPATAGGRGARDARSSGVVGQHDHGGRACSRTAASISPVDGPAPAAASGRRRPRPPRTAAPGPARRRTRRQPDARARAAADARASCSAKCVIRTRCGRPAPMPASTAAPGVVDVHVDVPQAVAADHDERVAERRELRARSAGDRASSALEQVHDLVARARRRPGRRTPESVDDGQRPRGGGRSRRRRRRPGRPRRASASSRTTGPGRPRRRRRPRRSAGELVGRAGERLARRRRAAAATTVGAGRPARAAPRRPRRGSRDGEDRALDRVGHRRVRLLGGERQRRADGAGRRSTSVSARTSAPARAAAGEDDPGVAAGAEQRAAGDGVEHASSAASSSAAARRPSAQRPRRSGRGWCRCRRPARGRR